MLHQNSPDKLNLGLEGGVVYRATPGTSRVLMGVGPVSEENQQNYRIQQAVNRYNNVPLPHMRPSTLFKCNLLKSKITKPGNVEQSTAVNVNRSKPETRYAAGHFPTVILGKANVRATKRNNVLSHLRANEPVLPISRFLDDTSDKYTDMKNTRSVLDVLQDLSRKRIHGKDDCDDVSKRRCKGLGGDQVQEGESFYKPLFVSKAKSNFVPKKDQTTQTQIPSAVNGVEETATPVSDPKSELRKKLARRNNEIFASLSSSINSAFFSKRKRAQSNVTEKETHSAKKQKVEETKQAEKEVAPVKAPPEKTMKKIETSVSPPAKDRMMSIYFDLKNAGEVKKNVLETLQKSPGESQFQRSVEAPSETVAPPAPKTPTSVPEKTESSKVTPSTFSLVKTTETSCEKPAEEPPKKPPTLDQSPVSSVSFKFLNDAEKTKPETTKAQETPSFSFGSLKPTSEKDVTPSFKFTPTTKESNSPAAPFKFGLSDPLSTPEVTKKVDDPKPSPVINQTKTLASGLTFSPNVSTVASTAISSQAPPSFSFGTKNEETKITTPSQPVQMPPAELPKFNFGTTTATSLFQATSTPTFTFSKKADTTDSTTPKSGGFSFDLKTSAADSKSSPSAPSFGFGSVKKDDTATTTASTGFSLTPSFSFGALKPTADSPAKFPPEESKPKIAVDKTASPSFGQSSTATSAAPFAFGQSKPEPTFNFGATKNPETSTAGFSFGSTKSDSGLKPTFSFGQVKPPTEPVTKSDETGTPKSTEVSIATSPSFTFSQSQPEKDRPLRSGFSFSQAGTTATATTATSGFSFNKNPTEPTNIGFSFSSSGSKPFSFGNKNENIPSKEEESKSAAAPTTTTTSGAIFSFGTTSSADVKPVQFGAPASEKEPFAKSIFGQQTSNSTNSEKPASSVFSRLGKTVSAEVKTDTPGDIFKTSTTDSNPAAGSLFKPAEAGASSIFGQTPAGNTPKSTFSFGQTATTTTAPPAYNSSTNPVTTSTATFGQTSSGFNFGAKTTTATGSSFSFGKTTNAPATQAFSFGNAPFGSSTSTTFGSGTPTPSAFGSTTTATPAFGSSSTVTPSFGSTTAAPPAFGSSTTATPAFGSTTAAPPAFGSSTTATPAFGSTTTAPPAFGSSATATPAFGSTTTAPPAFGSSATAPPSFGSTTTAPPAFGSSTTSTSAPSFGSNTTPFGSSTNSIATPSFGSTTTGPPAFGSGTGSLATPSFGSTAAATPAFGSPAGSTSTTAFRSTTTAPPAFGGTTPAFGTVAPAFGSSSSTFGAANTTAPPAFGTTTTTPAFGSNTNAFGSSSSFGNSSTTPSFGTSAFGTTAPPAFGNPADKPAFGSGTSGFPGAAPTPTFGASTAAPSPQFGNTGFGANTSNPGFGASFPSTNSTAGFGSAPPSAVTPTPTPFNFGSGNATSPPTFKFGSNTNQNAPFTFGSSNNSGSGFNFSAGSPGAFSFGANTSGFNQTPTPGNSGFQPGFGQTPTPFAPSATFSIGTGSSQPPRRHMARSRRRP